MKHNQHAKHAFARGSARKILKIAYSQTDFNGNFTRKSSSNIPLNTMHIDSLQEANYHLSTFLRYVATDFKFLYVALNECSNVATYH